MMRFQTVQPPAKNYVPQARQTSDRAQAIRPPAKEKRCFNCRQIGHLMFDCPRPERPKRSCYRCFKVGHQYRNCPMRTQIAAMSSCEDPDTIDDKSFIQLIPEAQ
ncbi:cellular nucleic acid-binding protein homolog [Drosophila willistoni]|uniref:cellular nucleic acid-binding protein homolog n=1 Tax=Drosophila willistoni TaxID=7260 RepID=UPI001F07315F|nr:cellular nucleic acid-binding protein homolog [Drosophila willistoni]XP_046869365.1 cellular nucleic acid-binding protein homolog [Drosophila willistoni]